MDQELEKSVIGPVWGSEDSQKLHTTFDSSSKHENAFLLNIVMIKFFEILNLSSLKRNQSLAII